jgi:TRAP-type C4-dicarboxylate transport system substrate-binding protein
MARTAPLIAAVVVAVALGTNACDSSDSDRAGGENPAKPPAGRATTLTLANVNSEPEVLQVFAEKVQNLSDGTLRIRFENNWGQGRRGNAEVNLIRDVQAGKADLGWAGSRAFDLVGDRAFGPLHAPMMIDSYALELKVLQDEAVVRPMLKSLDRLELEEVGVLPGPLRRPLATRRLGAPADWSGMRIGHAGGEQIARSLRALGARPRIIVSSGEFAGFDGVESHITSIAGNGYHHEAPYLTGNVVLWPRPLVLFAGDSVTRAQLALLRRAALAAAPAVVDDLRDSDEERLGVICRQDLKLSFASPSALAQMRQAFRPVYAGLKRDAGRRAALSRIEQIASSLGQPSEAVSCGGDEPPPSAAAIPDGTYEVTVTPRDALRAGIARDDPIVKQGVTQNKLELDKGNFTLESDKDPDGWEGTYSVYRDRITVTGIDGVTMTARWSFEHGRLRFEDISDPVREDVPGAGYQLVTWGSHPWEKVD